MRQTLHCHADRIELVLASHKVPARVTGGTVTPRLIRYHLSTPLGVKVRQVEGLSEEIALSLGSPSCRVYRHQGQVEVEVPRAQGQTVPLLPLCRRLAQEGARGAATVPAITAVLGLDHEGTPLLLRLPSPNVAHVLIAGTTGSGKTALARTLIASLALHNHPRSLQLLLVDPKGRGFRPFQGLPHLLRPVIADVDQALDALSRLVDEMVRRDQQGRDEPRLVLVLDELATSSRSAAVTWSRPSPASPSAAARPASISLPAPRSPPPPSSAAWSRATSPSASSAAWPAPRTPRSPPDWHAPAPSASSARAIS